MPKRRQDDVEAAIAMDERHAQAQRLPEGESRVDEQDRVVTVSVMLRRSALDALDREVYDQKLAGNRGFSRSKVVQKLVDDYLAAKAARD